MTIVRMDDDNDRCRWGDTAIIILSVVEVVGGVEKGMD